MADKRRSRIFWPEMGAKAPPQRRTDHDHQPPNWIARAFVAFALVHLLTVAAVVVVGAYAYQSYEYVQGRGAYRDAETSRVERLITRAVCDILSEFPTGDARADRLRARYDCPIPPGPEEVP